MISVSQPVAERSKRPGNQLDSFPRPKAWNWSYIRLAKLGHVAQCGKPCFGWRTLAYDSEQQEGNRCKKSDGRKNGDKCHFHQYFTWIILRIKNAPSAMLIKVI